MPTPPRDPGLIPEAPPWWPPLVRAAYIGAVHAEALSQAWRHRLVHYLHRERLTDVEIAYRTHESTYTVARIRRQLGLDPNVEQPVGDHVVFSEDALEHDRRRAAIEHAMVDRWATERGVA